jgi:L-ascorbate oxidase
MVKLALFASCWNALWAYKATWVWSEKFANPDGVEHLVYAVNGVFPPPTVRVLPGEEVEITVVNKLSSQSMAIHWHGQHHDGTPWQDGAAMFSQCPIPQGSEWTYKFHANKYPGTYLYHGHVGGSAARVFGAFIIDGDVSNHAAPAIGEHTFMLSDWWHISEQHMSAGILTTPFRWPGDPQSILVNGKGRFPCNANEMHTCSDGNEMTLVHKVSHGAYALCDDSKIPASERFEGSEGNTYLLRFIAGSLLSLFNVGIEGHIMTVIEVDGHPTEPYTTTSVDLNSGQRVAVLVTLDQSPRDYVIRFKTRSRKAVRTANAILHYLGSTTPLNDTAAAEVTVTQPAWNDHDFTRDFQNNIRGLYSGYTALPAVPAHDEVARRFVFLSTHENVAEGEYSNAKPSITSIDDAVGSGENRPEKFCHNGDSWLSRGIDKYSSDYKNVWMMGRMAFRKPTTPILGMLHYGIDVDQIREEYGHYEVEIGKVYDIVVNHYPNCYKSCDTHSWHLHSGHFWSLGTFPGKWTGSQQQMDALNVHNPSMRDSVSSASEGDENHKLPVDDPFQPCGYTVLRFRVTHAGLYLFHCHHLFHEMMGQMRLFYTNGSTIPAPPENLLTCSKMDAQIVHAPKSLGPKPAVEQAAMPQQTMEQSGMPVQTEQAVQVTLPSVHAGSTSNDIQINLTQAHTQVVPSQAQSGGHGNSMDLEAESMQPYNMTQDGGWIALLVLSIVLVIISIRSFMTLLKVEDLAHRISSACNNKQQTPV